MGERVLLGLVTVTHRDCVGGMKRTCFFATRTVDCSRHSERERQRERETEGKSGEREGSGERGDLVLIELHGHEQLIPIPDTHEACTR